MAEQSLPLADGTGWVHIRWRDVIPGPQLREQVDQSVQAVNPPLTERRSFIKSEPK